MRHAREDYMRIQDPWSEDDKHRTDRTFIPEREPVFLLRGQDRLAWVTVFFYSVLAFLFAKDRRIWRKSKHWSWVMFDWREKFPDLPPVQTVLKEGES